MTAFSEDHMALAAEYVLGTLDVDERTQVETMMSVDANFAALVQTWETTLGELHAMVDPVEPPAELWLRIRNATHGIAPAAESRLRFEPVVETPAPDIARVAPQTTGAQVFVLNERMRRWRGIATAAGAMAAALALFMVVESVRPDLLPGPLRRATTRIAAVPPQPGKYVAVLQRDAATPAFIMTLDAATRGVSVRRVSAEAEQGRSYELWLVSDRFPGPRSLGVIGDTAFTRAVLSNYDHDTINAATYAVSVEPTGGSPSGAPTGPMVYSGKLVEAVPAAAPAR